MLKKSFSLLSAVFLLLTVFPVIPPFDKWGDKLFVFILEISIYLPFIFGVIGILFALVGVKGNIKITLVIANILGLFLFLIIFLMGTIGFQEP